MKISIIVPVYNCEDYLNQCMDSLVNQTLQDIEIIAVDDGSTDQSLDILRIYEQKYPEKVKILVKENGGQASARNMALEIATGKYLGFVDSDDWVDLDMYSDMIQLADEKISNIVICDMVDHYMDRIVYHHSSEFDNKFKVTPSACNKIFRHDFVKTFRFPEGLWYEDFEYTTKALLCTDQYTCIHKGYYHCHCREVSTMFNHNAPKNLDILKIVEHLYDFAKEQDLLKQYQSDFDYIVIEHILITTINRVALQTHAEKRQVLKKLCNYCKTKIKNLKHTTAYQELPRNRKIIANLNYHGLYYISRTILWLKQKTKKDID